MSPCPTHTPNGLGYVAWHTWAEKQRGQSRQCPTCKLWMFRSEYGPGWAKAIRPLKVADHGYLLGEDA